MDTEQVVPEFCMSNSERTLKHSRDNRPHQDNGALTFQPEGSPDTTVSLKSAVQLHTEGETLGCVRRDAGQRTGVVVI